MESISPERLRYKLLLGKFAVRHVEEKGAYLIFSIDLPGLGLLICSGPKADVKEGDLLTLYTEVLAHAPTHQGTH